MSDTTEQAALDMAIKVLQARREVINEAIRGIEGIINDSRRMAGVNLAAPTAPPAVREETP